MVPSVLPRFARAATITTLKSGIFIIAVKLSASKIFLKSEGVGFLIFASTSAANHPAAIRGFNAVSHETEKPVAAESGWPRAISVNAAVRMPWKSTQYISAEMSTSVPTPEKAITMMKNAKRAVTIAPKMRPHRLCFTSARAKGAVAAFQGQQETVSRPVHDLPP